MSTAIADPPEVKAKPVAEAKPKPDSGAARRFAEGITGTKEKEKAKPDEKPKEGDGKPAAAAPKPKADKSKPAATPPAPVLDRETIASAVAEGMERGSKKPEPTSEVKSEEVELPPAEAKRLAVLERMEKSNPDKYKGRAKAYRDSYTKLLKYSEDWEKANPGKEFNEDDEEHKEFFDKNNVDWDDDDYTEALAELKSDEKVGAARKEIDQKFATIERAEKLRSEAPKIVQSQTTAALAYFADMDGEFAKVLKADGTLDTELGKKLTEADPIKAQIIVGGASRVEELVAETYKLFTNLVDYDGKNPNHIAINSFVLSKEEQLMKKPAKEQLDSEGRPFLTADAYWKLDEKQRAKHWTFSREDVDTMLTAAIAASVKQQVQYEEEKFQRIAKARGITIPEAKAAVADEQQTPAPAVESEEEETAGDDGKPSSPSAQAQPRINEVKGGAPQTDGKSRFRDGLLG